jgi:hypothetical protein
VPNLKKPSTCVSHELFDGKTKSSWSPGLVPVCSITPAGSSRTECANKHIERRQGTMAFRSLRTRFFRSRYSTSIANRMPQVCTASQGTIHRPWPGAMLALPNNPFCRFGLESATSADSAKILSRVSFRTSILFGSVAEFPRPRFITSYRGAGAAGAAGAVAGAAAPCPEP